LGFLSIFGFVGAIPCGCPSLQCDRFCGRAWGNHKGLPYEFVNGVLS
jgi:hypothetical protein